MTNVAECVSVSGGGRVKVSKEVKQIQSFVDIGSIMCSALETRVRLCGGGGRVGRLPLAGW